MSAPSNSSQNNNNKGGKKPKPVGRPPVKKRNSSQITYRRAVPKKTNIATVADNTNRPTTSTDITSSTNTATTSVSEQSLNQLRPNSVLLDHAYMLLPDVQHQNTYAACNNPNVDLCRDPCRMPVQSSLLSEIQNMDTEKSIKLFDTNTNRPISSGAYSATSTNSICHRTIYTNYPRTSVSETFPNQNAAISAHAIKREKNETEQISYSTVNVTPIPNKRQKMQSDKCSSKKQTSRDTQTPCTFASEIHEAGHNLTIGSASTLSIPENISERDVLSQNSVDTPDLLAQNVQNLNDPTFMELRRNFLAETDKITTLICENCKEKHFITHKARVIKCSRCKQGREAAYKFSDANNMNPGQRVPELSNLTFIEELLIAQNIPTMSIFRLPRGGQFGFKGHVISFPQNIEGWVTNLPRRINQLDILVLRKRSARADLPPSMFTVNRKRVLTALKWLNANNDYYKDKIHIDDDNLNALPEHGLIDLPPQLFADEAQETHENNEKADIANAEPESTDEDLGKNPITNSFAPTNIRHNPEMVAIEAAIANKEVVDWPNRDKEPINEFDTEGYIARAFPCLFPTGAADLKGNRTKKVTPHEYFSHMLRYFDGRFEANPRFVFLAYNTMLRWQSLQVGSVYVRKHPTDQDMSVAEIRELVESDRKKLSNKILRFGRQLRGTAQFWYSKTQELLAMSKQLGNATAFFTFSVADMQWPDLARFLNTENCSVAHAIAHAPLTVDSYVVKRFEIFFEKFLKPYLDIKDYWFRWEYQNRGSGHVHGVAWLNNAPNTKKATKLELAQYWDKFVSNWNPSIDPGDNPNNFFWPVETHPCSVRAADVVDIDKYLKDLVNICQKHTKCSSEYCLRTQKDGTQKCRFGFPRALQKQTTVDFIHDKKGNRKTMEIKSATNDPLINNHNRHCMVTWSANHDISITFDMTNAARYIAKYTSKSETASTSYAQVYNKIVCENLPPEATMQRTASALLLNTIGRDVSAQEAVHVVSSAPLFKCSRHFVSLKIDGESIEGPLFSESTSDVRKYMQRHECHENISFYDLLKAYTLQKRGNVYIAKERKGGDAVMQVWPTYSSDKNSETYSKYCMQYLIQHKPFRQWHQLTEGFADAIQAYNQFVENNPPDVEAARDYDLLEEEVQNAICDIKEDNENLVALPECDDWAQVIGPEEDDEILLPGHYPVPDPHFDWLAHSSNRQNLFGKAKDFLANEISSDKRNENNEKPHVNINLLNEKQKKVYDHVNKHQADITQAEPLRALVLGTAGVGKSYLIHALADLLGEKCQVVAPTGVAALNIGGSTIHSFLHLPIKDFKKLKGPALLKLQNKCSKLRYLIIDEVSMIGCKMLNQISDRLRQAFSNSDDQLFGGCSII